MTFSVTVSMTLSSGATISRRDEITASSADVASEHAIRAMRTQLRLGEPKALWTYAEKKEPAK